MTRKPLNTLVIFFLVVYALCIVLSLHTLLTQLNSTPHLEKLVLSSVLRHVGVFGDVLGYMECVQ